jgi:hypothetical protein
VGLQLLEHRVHALRRDALGQSLQGLVEEGGGGQVLLRESHGRSKQGGRLCRREAGLLAPGRHGFKQGTVGPGLGAFGEERLDGRRLLGAYRQDEQKHQQAQDRTPPEAR